MTLHPDRILFEDDHLLAVNKLSGELVVKGKGAVGKLPLLDFLKKDHPGLRALHRLDFETSGVVVFAKTKKAFDIIMEKKFDDWIKVYKTLVMGRLERRKGNIRFKLAARSGKGMVEAVTHYKALEYFGNSTYVEAEIETGRHHQIRRHFAAIKHPLVLDHVYGHKKFNGVFISEFRYRKFFLHASSVAFAHPITGERVKIEAPMPKSFEQVLKKLRALA